MLDATEPPMLDRSNASSLRARDFMQTDVLTISPETSLLDIHRLFLEEEIHGAPVVDDSGVVRGVISTVDLLRAVSDETQQARDASDIMTRELVTVEPNMPIAEVAETMRDQRVHRVLVIENRELLGVLTTFDLLRAFTGSANRAVAR